MSRYKNEYVVVTIQPYSPGFEEASAAIRELQGLQGGKEISESFGRTISGPANQVVNGETETWTMGPDGSSEGWGTSNAMDVFRQRFIGAARLCMYATIYHFHMKDDITDVPVTIEFHKYVEKDGDAELAIAHLDNMSKRRENDHN